MNDILKQRLVGALVLIALGVAFWPVIFVENERGTLDPTPQVVPMPELEDVAIPAPQPLANVEPVTLVEDIRAASDAGGSTAGAAGQGAPDSVAEGAADQPGQPASPVLDERGIPVAWVLQVATVSTRDRADRLTADLIAAGFKAYHRPMDKSGERLYRVYVGPVFEREKLSVAKRKIDEKFDVSAIIARYVP